ncbi:glucocorticoid modulatory element-binding protein 1-like [Aulostomus maculatus]
MEKEEEGESSGNNHKTQVILHLQPIHRGNCDIADTGTTVLAIEAHHDDSKAEGEGVEYGYPITCGESRAVLLFKKFVCPGINVRCVKFNDQLISPKQFVHLAGKATLKDWKRAIRLGGVMLRKMMDSGQIDFYQHDTVCSNTCRSTKFDMLINSTQLPLGTSVQPSPPCLALDPLGGQAPPLTGEVVHDAAEVEEPLEDKFSATAECSPAPAGPANPTTANGHAAKRRRTDAPDGTLSLWRGVADAGLMGEVLSSLQLEFLAALKGVELRSEKASLRETDAIILNSLCEMFGLLDSVKQTLDQRRSQSDDSKVPDGVYELEDILEERRKQVCVKNTAYKPQKHLRPQRPNPSNSQTQNLLSPIISNSVISPLSVMGLSAAPYSQLAVNPQHASSHFSASSGQLHRAGKGEEKKHELCETGKHEKLHRRGQEMTKKEETSEMHQDVGQQDPLLVSEDIEDIESLHDIEKVVFERKASKKHKT